MDIIDPKEKLLSDLQMRLSNKFELDDIRYISDMLTLVLGDYTITEMTTELALPNTESNMRLVQLFLMSKKVEGCTDRTIKFYKDEIMRFLLDVGKFVGDITANDVRINLVKMVMENGNSEVTSDNRRRCLSSFFSWLQAEEYITRNPMLKVKKMKASKTIKKPFSEEEVELLRNNARNLRERAIIETLLSTGMRASEIASCNIDDIESDQMIIMGKGKKERTVYLNAKARIAIKEYLATRTDSNSALFVTMDSPHERLQVSSYGATLRQLGCKLGIENVHPHRFRRTAATMALNRGMPIEQVKELLGHEQLDTTLIYAQSSQENLKMSHKKFVT